MDQGRGLKRLPGLLLSQPLCCQFAQLFVYQRQQLLRGVRIALVDRVQDLRDFVHAAVPVCRSDGRHYSVTQSTMPQAAIDLTGRLPNTVRLPARFAAKSTTEFQTSRGDEFPDRQGRAVKGLSY